jgi:pyruvate dehydrogenase phosphatase
VRRDADTPPVRSARYGQWGAEKRFVIRDANAATHLARNALGGADTDLLNALLLTSAPRARTFRCATCPC